MAIQGVMRGKNRTQLGLCLGLVTAGTALSLTLLGCRAQLAIGGSDADGGTGEVSDTGAPTIGDTGAVPVDTGAPSDAGITYSVLPDGGEIAIPPQTLAVKKVDLLFMIDNSASMGDKQAYLAQAIPELVDRLVTPNCIDSAGTVYGASTPGTDGVPTCAQGTLEFPAVEDMHVGIVSSSLGPRLGDQVNGPNYGACAAASVVTINGTVLNEHNDDQGHLITRSSTAGAYTETALPDAPSGFLDWFPTVPANSGSSPTPGAVAITSSTQLVSDFTDMIQGVHEFGCGIESQLESWYRFLIQPDPYATLSLDSSQHAQWVGVDTTILQQRHDFLRPDSAVVIVDLTDENDSEIDVRSLGGQGYLFMSTAFQPYRGTSACDTNPADPACQSCAYFLQNGGTGDPNCAGTEVDDAGTGGTDRYTSPYDWGYDLNLRHVHMKAKYGLDPQFPVARYQNGLLSTTVPDRVGEYPSGATGYVGSNNCTNPLYASSLPNPSVAGTFSATIATTPTVADVTTLCNLQPGARTPGLVYFLHIGGVPGTLLHYTAGNAAASALTDADWTKILGANPFAYDYTGIDPHMVESYAPRAGLPAPTAANNADPISGREWITNNTNPAHIDLNVDREYACIFPLPQPRDCSNAAGVWTIPVDQYSCDCSSTGLTAAETSPVCNPSNPNQQVAAKAYPTIRELELVKLLGAQGVVGSICPTDTVDNAQGNDPLFGYRPAIDTLFTHMRSTLAFPAL
jgi:hypothetical protein